MKSDKFTVVTPEGKTYGQDECARTGDGEEYLIMANSWDGEGRHSFVWQSAPVGTQAFIAN
jgi:hypothetical protein